MNIGEVFCGYQINEHLGFGSFGDVYLAEKENKKYALKFLRVGPDGAGLDIAAFNKENETWMKANGHPNILRIYESFKEKGKFVIVMDYAEGGSLKGKTFSREQSSKLIIKVLEGIKHLHDLNIIHRDIKPGNILLRNNSPVLCDFGLARDLDLTQSTKGAGTFAYFSPEIINKNREYLRHPLNDLWAAAVTYYKLLTGNLPFEVAQLANFNEIDFPEISEDLRVFFTKAFRKNPNERFQSAEEMLMQVQEGEKIRIESELTAAISEKLEKQFREKFDTEINSLKEMNKTLEEQAKKDKENFLNKTQEKNAEIKELSDKIISLSSHSFLEKEKSRFDSNKKELEQEIKSRDKIISEFEKTIEDYSCRQKSLEEEIGSYENEYVQLSEKIKVAGNELFRAKSIIEELEKSRTGNKTEIQKLQSLNQTLQKNATENRESIRNKDAELLALKKANSELITMSPSRFFATFGKVAMPLVIILVIVLYSQSSSKVPQSTTIQTNQISQNCVNNNGFQCVIDSYLANIKKYPANFKYYLELADIYRYKINETDTEKKKENQNKAIELYNQLLVAKGSTEFKKEFELTNNDKSNVLFGLAYANKNLGNFDEAVKYYEASNQISNGGSSLNLAIIFEDSNYNKKDPKKALEHYKNYLERTKDNNDDESLKQRESALKRITELEKEIAAANLSSNISINSLRLNTNSNSGRLNSNSFTGNINWNLNDVNRYLRNSNSSLKLRKINSNILPLK